MYASPLPAAFHVVDEAAEAHQRLLHFLVAVEPRLLARADVRHPAIGEFLRGVVEPQVLAAGQRVVIDRGLDEIAGDVAFVIAAIRGRSSASGHFVAIARSVNAVCR